MTERLHFERMLAAETSADWLREFADYQAYMSVNIEIPRRLREAADRLDGKGRLDGEPEPQELLRQLYEALGHEWVAQPVTPKSLWERCLREVREHVTNRTSGERPDAPVLPRAGERGYEQARQFGEEMNATRLSNDRIRDILLGGSADKTTTEYELRALAEEVHDHREQQRLRTEMQGIDHAAPR